MKRNIIAEIIDLKQREKRNATHLFELRIQDLKIACDQITTHKLSNELYKQIPIALVATMESYFYSVVAKIIDHGEPFLSNVAKFNQAKDVKFDFEIVKALNAKDFTIGNFIAHVLSFNNLNDINLNLSILLDVNFLKELKAHRRKSIFEDNNHTSESFITNADSIIKSINRTFELRHIFCHEFAYKYQIDVSEIKDCLVNTELFLKQTSNYIHEALYPGSPETQTDMNIESFEEYCKLDEELEDLFKRIKEAHQNAFDGINVKLFDRMVRYWKRYRDLKGDFDSDYVRGGTMMPLVSNNSRSYVTSLMIEQLKSELKSISK
ncbi:DUF1311 domain-containing protein [Mucilaginibacter terrenus]|uniref:DUF1311 domain-containing protein n=1 Tax=Mucilaginibacter terrenus TaxID=2482727 RepID=A0A3E2NLK8_9SPHI|nr:lysozyme inhibitor LprI family protein [Mucilaginibacter terrenus]RFZ81858.1 DUF1311 domain-containing protein [Mucilaginibacter terrenus]